MLTVVTGASGFVGNALVRALVAEGRKVRAVDLVRSPGLDGLDVEWMRADVLDPSSLRASFEGATTVYHLAAVISITGDPTGKVWATNVDGVRNAAEAALDARVERMIHCSSVHAFATMRAGELITEASPRATSPHLPAYDRSKAAGEAELHRVIDRGLDAVIVNPTAVIGPDDHTGSRMNRVIVTMFRRRLPALIDGGFDWVDVRDVVDSMMSAEQSGRTGENYLLPGRFLSLRELALVAEEVSGVPMAPVTVPMWFARMWSPLADVAARRTGNPLWYTTESLRAVRMSPRVSGAKAAEELGHRPRPMEETVGDIYHWALDSGLLGHPRQGRAPSSPDRQVPETVDGP